MLKRRAGSIVTLAVVLLSSCLDLEKVTAPNPPQLVVQGVLNFDDSQQEVFVSLARTGNATHDQPVGGAKVSMTTPIGNTERSGLLVDSLGKCCVPGVYVFDTPGQPLVAGGTYVLHVQAPSGDEVTGTTTIPVAPRPVAIPARVFFRDRDTLRLSWPHVVGARSYEVLVEGDSPFPQYRVFTDTSIAIPGMALTIYGDMVFNVGLVNVIVSAVDANYYEYYRAQSDPLAGAPPSKLTGAVGVFGSIAPIIYTGLNVR